MISCTEILSLEIVPAGDIIAATNLCKRFLAVISPLDRFAPLVVGDFRRPPHFHGAPLGAGAAFDRAGLNEYPLHFVERDFLRPPVVKLRGARGGMVGHLGGAFKRAAVFQVSGDARGAKGVVADMCGDTAGFGAPLNCRIGVGLGQGVAGELPGRPALGLKQQRLRLVRQPRAVDIFMQVGLKIVMAGQGMACCLPPFSCKRTHSRVPGIHVVDLHAHRRADARRTASVTQTLLSGVAARRTSPFPQDFALLGTNVSEVWPVGGRIGLFLKGLVTGASELTPPPGGEARQRRNAAISPGSDRSPPSNAHRNRHCWIVGASCERADVLAKNVSKETAKARKKNLCDIEDYRLPL